MNNTEIRQLKDELDLRILTTIDYINSGYSSEFILIQIPGKIGGIFKVLASVKRLEKLRVQCRRSNMFSSKNDSLLVPRESGCLLNRPKVTLKEFVVDNELDNAKEYAHLTGQKL